MTQRFESPAQSVRTVLHLTPAVTTAALVSAQRHGMSIGRWLEGLIVHGCVADLATPSSQLRDPLALELFAHVASYSPGLLTGRWRLLLDRCRLDDELWQYPNVTVDEAEAGEDCQPYLDVEALRRRWPALVAGAFLMS
jgi:hypothetical protein